MKNKGFTLIELLAVIVILAIIALIATPIILNIIGESKIKSLEISTSEYIRAVNISLMNKEINENVSDGLYTITDDGKKIVLGDKEIDIEYEGKGLKSGQLLIEDSKVTRVLKGFIDDYYARVTDEDITILKDLKENTLVDGQTFNVAIKNLVKDIDGTDATYKTVDKTVKRIEFLQDGVLPEGYTKEELEELPNVDLSKAGNGSIKGYYNEETGAIYVYSDGYISFINVVIMFYNFQSVEEIEFNLIDTSKVTSMAQMFYGCNNLKTLNLTGFDTSKVVDMSYIFDRCSSLTTLDLTMFDTRKVTTMSYMFYGCSKLTTLDLSNFDTSNVRGAGMQGMFMYCNNLKEIKGIEKFNTSKVTDMYYMFAGCDFETIDLSSFDTSSVTNMQSMFAGCDKLKYIKFGEKFDTSKVNNMNSMFSNCKGLETLNLSNFNTSSVVSMISMFSGCSNLTTLDLSTFDTTLVTSFSNIFNSCSNLKEILVSDKWTLNKDLLSDTKANDYTIKN